MKKLHREVFESLHALSPWYRGWEGSLSFREFFLKSITSCCVVEISNAKGVNAARSFGDLADRQLAENLFPGFPVIWRVWSVVVATLSVIESVKILPPHLHKNSPFLIHGEVEAHCQTRSGLSSFATATSFSKQELRKDQERLECSVDCLGILICRGTFPIEQDLVVDLSPL